MEKVKRLRLGEIEFLRISRGTQFHVIWNIESLGEFKNNPIHFVDLDGNDFDFGNRTFDFGTLIVVSLS